jgi:hypothetical protein
MNDRIKELEKQSYVTSTETVKKSGWDNDRPPFEYHNVTKPVFSLEKFAELIIEECAEVCTDAYYTQDGYGITAADARCAALIKSHFGLSNE